MLNLQDLLTQTKNTLFKDSSEKDVIVSVFKNIIDITLEREDISIKRDVLYIKSNVYIKSEIQLHKTALLREIHKQKIGKAINDIQ